MTLDTFVALIGIVLSLILAIGLSRFRAFKLSSQLIMAGAWLVIIVGAALAFGAYRG